MGTISFIQEKKLCIYSVYEGKNFVQSSTTFEVGKKITLPPFVNKILRDEDETLKKVIYSDIAEGARAFLLDNDNIEEISASLSKGILKIYISSKERLIAHISELRERQISFLSME